MIKITLYGSSVRVIVVQLQLIILSSYDKNKVLFDKMSMFAMYYTNTYLTQICVVFIRFNKSTCDMKLSWFRANQSRLLLHLNAAHLAEKCKYQFEHMASFRSATNIIMC